MLAASNLNLTAFTREQLESMIADAAYSQPHGMFLRAVLERQMLDLRFAFAVVMDGDGIHDLNHKLGMDEVDRRVKMAVAAATRDNDLPVKWAGDEWVILLSTDCHTLSDAQVIAARILNAFNAQGIRVTAVVREIQGEQTTEDATRAILNGLDEIMQAKARRDRTLLRRIRKAFFALFPEFGRR